MLNRATPYLLASKMLHAEVEKQARRMRSALEALPRDKLPITMSVFPAGSCGDVSLLLGAYLKDSGIADFEYVSGARGSHNDNTWTTHAWLVRGSLIVDITADQYEDAPGKIIVSEDSPWHRTFETESGQPSDIRVWSGPGPFTYTHYMSCCIRACLLKRCDETAT